MIQEPPAPPAAPPELDLSTNPLRQGLRLPRTPEPCAIVIFGATGDLSHRKLLPALYNLALDGLLPAGTSIVGFARQEYTHETFREEMRKAVNQHSRNKPVNEKVWETFAQGLFYLTSTFEDSNGYAQLEKFLGQLDHERGNAGNRLYYLATPPSFYETIVQNLGQHGMDENKADRTCWRRVVVEKPFGRDLPSAKHLNKALYQVFDESEIYRIDHYLGKETVQNLIVFRFGNGIFEPIWNRRYIDHVQITVAESIGIEGRAGYYEQAGTVRDMLQNHMLQLLALTCMEPPAAFDAQAVRDEKLKVLKAIAPPDPKNFVRGQYGSGTLNGQSVAGYRQEERVSPDSMTDTFIALKLHVDNWRWADVPFYLRSGKRLPKRVTEIAIQFKRPPLALFKEAAPEGLDPNVLAMNIQPDEGISLRFEGKLPGTTLRIRPVTMDFRYGTSFGLPAPDAYERLLLDAMLGDSTLFTRSDEVETAWALVDKVVADWGKQPQPQFPNYEAGTWGPDSARDLIAHDGRTWRRL